MVSKQKARDPSLTAGMRRRFARDLVRVFQRAKPKIVEAMLPYRHLAVSPGVSDFSNLKYLMTNLIMTPGTPVIEKYMRQFYMIGNNRAIQELRGAGATVSLFMPIDQKAIDTLQKLELSNLQGISDEMSKKIVQELSQGMLKGEDATKLARRINGAVDIGKSRATTMARTESMRAFNTAANARYDAHNVHRFRLKTSRLPNVCKICWPLEDTEYDEDDRPDLPLHPNCACILQPIIERIAR